MGTEDWQENLFGELEPPSPPVSDWSLFKLEGEALAKFAEAMKTAGASLGAGLGKLAKSINVQGIAEEHAKVFSEVSYAPYGPYTMEFDALFWQAQHSFPVAPLSRIGIISGITS